MGYCRDCRWWDGTNPEAWGGCHLFSAPNGPTPPRSDPSLWNENGAANISITGIDVSGASIGFYTDHDFGCVQFEAKAG